MKEIKKTGTIATIQTLSETQITLYQKIQELTDKLNEVIEWCNNHDSTATE